MERHIMHVIITIATLYSNWVTSTTKSIKLHTPWDSMILGLKYSIAANVVVYFRLIHLHHHHLLPRITHHLPHHHPIAAKLKTTILQTVLFEPWTLSSWSDST